MINSNFKHLILTSQGMVGYCFQINTTNYIFFYFFFKQNKHKLSEENFLTEIDTYLIVPFVPRSDQWQKASSSQSSKSRNSILPLNVW